MKFWRFGKSKREKKSMRKKSRGITTWAELKRTCIMKKKGHKRDTRNERKKNRKKITASLANNK
jgi:hypothetical protein